MVQVLAGVVILFSALVPLGQDPRAHHLGQLTEQFGAKCVTQEDASVTHVVAANSGSAKAQWALAHGKHLVSRHWYAGLFIHPIVDITHHDAPYICCLYADSCTNTLQARVSG